MVNLKKLVLNKLKQIEDPELGISIYDLGLIYKYSISNDQVNITMTLTSTGCPLYPKIKNDIIKQLKDIKGINKVKIRLVFDPPWDIDKMTPVGKTILGI